NTDSDLPLQNIQQSANVNLKNTSETTTTHTPPSRSSYRTSGKLINSDGTEIPVPSSPGEQHVTATDNNKNNKAKMKQKQEQSANANNNTNSIMNNPIVS